MDENRKYTGVWVFVATALGTMAGYAIIRYVERRGFNVKGYARKFADYLDKKDSERRDYGYGNKEDI